MSARPVGWMKVRSAAGAVREDWTPLRDTSHSADRMEAR